MPMTAIGWQARRAIDRIPLTRYCTETWMSAVVKSGKFTVHTGCL